MKHLKFILFGFFCALLVFMGFYLHEQTKLAGASISNDSGGYNSTTSPVSTLIILKNSAGVLGSVIVTGGQTTGGLRLYDATTSNSQLRTGQLATSSIWLADFWGVSSTTYVFDTQFRYGLLFEKVGTLGTTTITWK